MSSSALKSGDAITWNFKLLGHHELAGFGGMGEGMAVQVAKDGRRIIWLAHESAPKNFTAVDVTNPRNPTIVVQTDLPESFMRSNSLEITGDIMAVVAIIPAAAIATPYKPAHAYEPQIPPANTRIGKNVDSIPTAKPPITFVACPVED